MANTKVTTRVIADDAINSDKLASGLTLGGDTTLSGHLDLANDKRIRLGDSDELQLHAHNSGYGHLQNTGTFFIDAEVFEFRTDNDDLATALTLNAAQLATFANGITATAGTGTVTATTFSGALSGTIASATTATTQSASDNTTKVATTAFVGTAISNLVDSSPSALNTLNELAAALGDDANFSTTVTNSIATKLPLAGGTMSGALNMGSQNITNAGTIASGAISTSSSVAVTGAASAGISEGLLIDWSTNLARFLTYDSSSGSEIAFYTQPNGGSTTQALRIDSSQNTTFAGTISVGGVSSRTLGAVTGEYGTLQVNGSGAGGYEGISIDGRVVLMTDGGSIAGLYNDVDNEWLFRADLNGATNLYYNNVGILTTDADGISVRGAATNIGQIRLSTASSSYFLKGGGNLGYIGYGTGGYHRWFGSDGVEDMRLDSSGRLGINRTPAIANSKLEVGGADNVPLINVEASGATAGVGIGSSAMKFFYGTTHQASIHAGGQIQGSVSGRNFGLGSGWTTFGRLFNAQGSPIVIRVLVGHNSYGTFDDFITDTYAYGISANTVVNIGTTSTGSVYTASLRKVKKIGGDYSSGDGGWEFQINRNQSYGFTVHMQVMGANSSWTWVLG